MQQFAAVRTREIYRSSNGVDDASVGFSTRRDEPNGELDAYAVDVGIELLVLDIQRSHCPRPSMRYSVGSGLAPKCPFRSIRTCCATAAATPWRTRATTHGRYRPGSGTRISSTPCATPSWHRIGSRTSGVDAASNAGMHDPPWGYGDVLRHQTEDVIMY
jgi:hypothetical protein